MSQSKGTILVIDDIAEVLEFCSACLTGHGYTVFTTTTVFCADVILREKPVLILLDVCMPGLPGDQVAQCFVGTDLLKYSSLVLHSNLPEVELWHKVKKTGADGYIPKCSSVEEFCQKVDDWIDRIHRGEIERLRLS